MTPTFWTISTHASKFAKYIMLCLVIMILGFSLFVLSTTLIDIYFWGVSFIVSLILLVFIYRKVIAEISQPVRFKLYHDGRLFYQAQAGMHWEQLQLVSSQRSHYVVWLNATNGHQKFGWILFFDAMPESQFRTLHRWLVSRS